MLRLHLIRHAESENNAKPENERVEDPGITPLGEQQAIQLGRWLKAMPMDCIITSPFRRALQTTSYVAQTSKVAIEIDPETYEEGGCYRGHGTNVSGAPGYNRAEILQWIPNAQVHESIQDNGWWNGRIPETREQAIERADRIVQNLTERFFGQDVTVVMIIHADIIRHMLTKMLADCVNTKRLGPLCNTGITRLDLVNDSWNLQWLNSIGHLSPGIVTDSNG